MEEFSNDTPFQSMIHLIEEELMTIGFMSFMFKIVLDKVELQEVWKLGLEFSDTVIPMITFSFCVQGLVLIVMSLLQCKDWSRAYNISLTDLIHDRMDEEKINPSWMPQNWLSAVVYHSQLEYLIHDDAFWISYKINHRAFPFDEYVERVMERFLSSVTSVRFVDWGILTIFCLGNWMRVHFYAPYEECEKKYEELAKEDINTAEKLISQCNEAH